MVGNKLVSLGRIERRKLESSPVSAVDLFCGAGGLTYGLMCAGVAVRAGVDIDPAAEYAYSVNNVGANFLRADVAQISAPGMRKLFEPGKVRLLAGCAPCQPFSKLTNGSEKHRAWDLLDSFGRIVENVRPEIVTMENVAELAGRGKEVLDRFLRALRRGQYSVDWRIVNATEFGAPQSRKRLVLLASRLGDIQVPVGSSTTGTTVRLAIGQQRPIAAGETDPDDVLHTAAKLSPLNLRRLKATPHDGGSRDAWPKALIPDCYRRETGARYLSIYGRMWWDRPAPTMTTLCNGIGNGRFGHPEQDRAITLREAALLQTFPRSYKFWPTDEKLNASAVARLIGNAVPPLLGKVIGLQVMDHVRQTRTSS